MAGRGPTALRPIVMALHWATIVLIVAWLVGRLPGWTLALHASIWCAVALIWGPRGGPSPALSGRLRRIAWRSHAALLVVYAVGATLAFLDLPMARPILLITLGASALHGVFNLWRSSVLRDGSLRRMTPTALH